MSATLERMLRMVLMNQIELMAALDELLGPEPDTEEDIATRAEIQANLNEAIEQTLASLKELNLPSPTSGPA
jgi:predicted RNase H-like HicB family nuclease